MADLNKDILKLQNLQKSHAIHHYNDCLHYVRRVLSKSTVYSVHHDLWMLYSVRFSCLIINTYFNISLPEVVSCELSSQHYVVNFADCGSLLLHKDYSFDSVLAQILYKFSLNIDLPKNK